jgi:hypothetical protein
MNGFRRWMLCAMMVALAVSQAGAAPPLTTIQDVLFTADGSRFDGIATISWSSFQAADNSTIDAHTLRVDIENGFLRVQLVPTTNALTAAGYTVIYNSEGRTQFTENWAVSPSSTPLRVRDVRTGGTPGSVIGNPPPPITTPPVQITDIVGLANELNARPTMGPGFSASRTAVINGTGALEAALGSLSDCVHVDGTSGPCGGASSGGPSNAVPGFIDGESPAGAANGSNLVFTLQAAPSPASSLALYRNGLRLRAGGDYAITNTTITFAVAAPQSGDTLQASYRTGLTLVGIGFIDGETPAGATDGANRSFSVAQIPLPAASLEVFRNGIRMKSGVDYTVTGGVITFQPAATPQIGDSLQCSYRIAQ